MSAYEAILRHPSLVPYRSILQRCNLTDYVLPNLIYDKQRSDTEKSDLLSSIPLASGMVMSGQKIIDRGEIVNDYTYRVLNSFEREMQRRQRLQEAEITNTLIGQLIVCDHTCDAFHDLSCFIPQGLFPQNRENILCSMRC